MLMGLLAADIYILIALFGVLMELGSGIFTGIFLRDCLLNLALFLAADQLFLNGVACIGVGVLLLAALENLLHLIAVIAVGMLGLCADQDLLSLIACIGMLMILGADQILSCLIAGAIMGVLLFQAVQGLADLVAFIRMYMDRCGAVQSLDLLIALGTMVMDSRPFGILERIRLRLSFLKLADQSALDTLGSMLVLFQAAAGHIGLSNAHKAQLPGHRQHDDHRQNAERSQDLFPPCAVLF